MKLPTIDPAFRWSEERWGLGLRCRELEPTAQHLFSTRQLQLRNPDTSGPNEAAWAEAAAAVGVSADRIVRIKQVHGNTVRVIRNGLAEKLHERPAADAVISNHPGLALAVQVADCVPVLLVDPTTGAAGAIHAGWRGTNVRISAATVEAMRRELNVEPPNLLAAIGPSIGACCYEVGSEVFDAFRQIATDGDVSRWFSRSPGGSLHLDLWAANRDQLVAAGLRPDRIFVAGLCTLTHADLFDSYRAAGKNTGRMAALVTVPHAIE